MSDDSLFIDDDDRYSRLRLIAWWEQEKLVAARVMVVGAGALGNEVLKNLALMGVGQIYVIDFDEIEQSNLTRSVLFRESDCGRPKADAAADAIRGMNPDVQISAFSANIITDIGLGLFRDVDVVIGCLDNREARLWVNRCCWKVSTPWIDGGIQEINGVAKVFVPPDSSCYECAMTENDYRLINLRYSCPLLRQEDILAGKVPTAPTISSIIAGLQTQEALKLIHGMPVAAGTATVFNGISNQVYNTKFQRREDCLSHETYDEPVKLPLAAAENTARDLFAAIRNQGDIEDSVVLRLNLDRDLVTSLDCSACGSSRSIMRPLQAVGMREATCPECGEASRPTMTHAITEDSPFAGELLIKLGIPTYDIVRVSGAGQGGVYLLANDTSSVMITASDQASA